jgi:hypothetical protein
MASVDADLSSGAKGIACDAVTAARPRPIANAEIARIFMDFPFSLMDGEIDRLNDAKPVTAKSSFADRDKRQGVSPQRDECSLNPAFSFHRRSREGQDDAGGKRRRLTRPPRATTAAHNRMMTRARGV